MEDVVAIPRYDGHELALHFGLDLFDGFGQFAESREALHQNGDEVLKILFRICLRFQALQDVNVIFNGDCSGGGGNVVIGVDGLFRNCQIRRKTSLSNGETLSLME